MYVISGCLLGQNCKYDGGNNRNEDVVKFCERKEYITVCPECSGNLPVPRPAAEKVGSRIINEKGKDVTEAFVKGADISLKTCEMLSQIKGEPLEGAILKANSPSCGFGKIYDGTFTKTLTDGNGVFAGRLSQRGVEVINEHNTERMAQWLNDEE